MFDQIGAKLFGKKKQDDLQIEETDSLIIYGVAVADSANGMVEVRIDDDIYAADVDLDNEDNYVEVSLTDDIINENDEEDEAATQDDSTYDEGGQED